ncbi:hypothetical protein ACWCQL_10310 [Streptomyces sp. NPDC002073]|uniref:hypothetical protein n=1 Tax=Streptomyces sp. NBC_00239 TaxID=2903640 RepID=UPI002E2C0A30|nr:hypothetical protein [Streptomyces sp. NBC_00239]
MSYDRPGARRDARPGAKSGEWLGWQVALVLVAALLVFAPFVLYSWAAIGPRPQPRPQAAPPPPVAQDVTLTGCRVDPASRRVVADIRVTSRRAQPARYVVTVEFRRDAGKPGESGRDAVVDLAPRGSAGREVRGPVWAAGVVPYCGVSSVVLERAVP